MESSINKNVYKKSRRERVYDGLRAAVTADDSYVGKRIAPMKELAEQFGTSVGTIQLALDQLEEEGFVKRRHGIGTFVAREAPPLVEADHVLLCVQLDDEVWGQLAKQIVADLNTHERVASTVDTSGGNLVSLLHRAARGSITTFIIRGMLSFPFHVLEDPAFRGKRIIALEEWASSIVPPGMYQVLHDYADGGRQLARYLWDRGHRRVAVAARPRVLGALDQRDDWLWGACRGRAFIDYWTAHGGTWVPLPVYLCPSAISRCDVDLAGMCDLLTGSDPVTAVFGYRDLEGWTVQSLLRQYRPDLLEQVEIVGYGDTFWSRAALPALTTVAYPVKEIARHVKRLFEAPVSKDADLPSRVIVRPSLVIRNENTEYDMARGSKRDGDAPAAKTDPGATPHVEPG